MTPALEIDPAQNKSGALWGFQVHLGIFALVMALLAGINIWHGKPYWALWVLLGWGLGMGLHAVLAFGRKGDSGAKS